jgi:hypothetical protein
LINLLFLHAHLCLYICVVCNSFFNIVWSIVKYLLIKFPMCSFEEKLYWEAFLFKVIHGHVLNFLIAILSQKKTLYFTKHDRIIFQKFSETIHSMCIVLHINNKIDFSKFFNGWWIVILDYCLFVSIFSYNFFNVFINVGQLLMHVVNFTKKCRWS